MVWKKNVVLTNITFWASHPLATADRYSLKTKTWYERCETHNIAFYPSVLADTGEMAEDRATLMASFCCKRTASVGCSVCYGPPTTAMVVFGSPLWWLPLAILLRVYSGRYCPVPLSYLVLFVCPLVFLKWDTSAWWSTGGAQFSLLRSWFVGSGTALWQLLLSFPTLVYARRFGGPGISGA